MQQRGRALLIRQAKHCFPFDWLLEQVPNAAEITLAWGSYAGSEQKIPGGRN